MLIQQKTNKNGHIIFYKVDTFTRKLTRISHWDIRDLQKSKTPFMIQTVGA